MTSSQLTTLKADILADPVLSLIDHTSTAGYIQLAAVYNAQASPTFTVWKTNVSIGDVGKNFSSSELGGLTSANLQRLQTLAQYRASGVNPTLATDRAFFDDVFSGAGGTNTRAALLILWKRLATRAEKLFATGTGSDAVPATLSFEGIVSPNDISAAFS